MKKIRDYFGTKTAIKCENEQQWEKLKELCGDRLMHNTPFNDYYNYFMLEECGDGFNESSDYKKTYQILPYSDFVSDVPELVGVEMEVSDNEKEWHKRIVLGKYELGFVCLTLNKNIVPYKHARPITKKVLTATLQELAEMLNVDEIQLK